MSLEVTTTSGQFDALFWLLVAICGAIAAFVLVGIVVIAVRYHHSRDRERGVLVERSTPVEVGWAIAATVIFVGIFVLGVRAFRDVQGPASVRAGGPAPLDVLVTAKRWMWKFEHPSGRREIDALHVPAGRPVRLHMTSEDVIHSFFVPAFRTKQDVLPGRTTTLWFQAEEPGTYPLLCAEYCGRDHSQMRGEVVVMEPHAYAKWLESPGAESEATLVSAGEELFERLDCEACHVTHERHRAPPLEGLWGRRVTLSDGRQVTADEAYLRESILDPAASVVAGYEPKMPTFRARLTEAELTRLILYLKTLGRQKGQPR